MRRTLPELARLARVFWLIAGLVAGLAACKHDLDALQADLLRDGGAGSGGQSGTVDADAGPTTNVRACEPCDALTATATELGFRTCCRGIANRECGMTFGVGNACLPLNAPGEPNSACGGATAGGTQLQGCCRPDARCGLAADRLGLGCVARDQILPEVGGSDELVACEYACTEDDDCGLEAPNFVCAEGPGGPRFCAETCKRDEACRRWPDFVCGLRNDVAMNRVLSYCQQPIGEIVTGEVCFNADDCVHGVCLLTSADQGRCSELCDSDVAGDCPNRKTCIGSKISVPDPEAAVDAGGPDDGTLPFDICGL